MKIYIFKSSLAELQSTVDVLPDINQTLLLIKHTCHIPRGHPNSLYFTLPLPTHLFALAESSACSLERESVPVGR